MAQRYWDNLGYRALQGGIDGVDADSDIYLSSTILVIQNLKTADYSGKCEESGC